MFALILALVGCLTPETFMRNYIESNCDFVDACSEGGVSDFCADDDQLAEAAAVVDCPTWDAAGAADCLDAMSERTCDDPSMGEGVCDFDAFCGQ